MKTPEVSVIIPTFNRENVLKRAIDSVLNQSYRDFELIIVDDASTDNTETMIKTIKDSRIRCVRLNTNGGPAKARNEGVRIAEGKYIAFQDSDDFWRTEKLQKQVDFLEKNPEYPFVFCKIIGKEEPYTLIPPENSFDTEEYEHGFLDILLISNKIGTPSMMMKKSLFEELGGFNSKLRTMEDWDLALRAADSHPIGYISDILVEADLSHDGVNSIRGEESIKTELAILSRYWKNHKDKTVFENLVCLICTDISNLKKEKQQEYFLKLDSIVPRSFYLELLSDYKFRLDKALLEASDNQKNADHLKDGLENEKEHVRELELSLKNEKKHINEVIASLNNKQKHEKKLEASLKNEQKHVTELEASLENEQKHVTELEASLENEQKHVTELEASLENEQKHVTELEASLENEQKHVTELEASLENEQKHVTELEASLENEQKHVAELEASLENEQKHVAELEASIGFIRQHEAELEAVVANDQLVIQDKDRQIAELKKLLKEG